jgi:hypothetical protein
MNIKMKNILLIDDNEMDNYISEYIIKASNIVEKINVFNSPIEALEYLAMVQSNQEKFPFFLTSICLTWMALVFLMNILNFGGYH